MCVVPSELCDVCVMYLTIWNCQQENNVLLNLNGFILLQIPKLHEEIINLCCLQQVYGQYIPYVKVKYTMCINEVPVQMQMYHFTV